MIKVKSNKCKTWVRIRIRIGFKVGSRIRTRFNDANPQHCFKVMYFDIKKTITLSKLPTVEENSFSAPYQTHQGLLMEDLLVAEDSPHRNLMLSSASGGQEAAAPGRLSTSCPAGSAAAIERATALGCPRSLPGTL